MTVFISNLAKIKLIVVRKLTQKIMKSFEIYVSEAQWLLSKICKISAKQLEEQFEYNFNNEHDVSVCIKMLTQIRTEGVKKAWPFKCAWNLWICIIQIKWWIFRTSDSPLSDSGHFLYYIENAVTCDSTLSIFYPNVNITKCPILSITATQMLISDVSMCK